MSNTKVAISGYTKEEIYNGNIRYRNYSPDLVGLQLTSEGGTPLFTMGNFSITTNLDPKLSKTYTTNKFSDFVTLSNMNLDVAQSQLLLANNTGVYLNLDKSNISYYAKFGSFSEFVRVALENIIINWPASLYINPVALDVNGFQIQGYTYENYYYDVITDKATFKINVNFINNMYGINYLVSGSLANTFNEPNQLRNLTQNYLSYTVLFNDAEYKVLGFSGATYTSNDYIQLQVKGNPFSASTQRVTYHVKPNNIQTELFFNSLDEFEYYLLNRYVYPLYTAKFSYPLKTDTGVVLYTTKNFTWPTTDGYNLDFDTDDYVNYAGQLLDLANNSDLTKSSLMTRFLVTEAITGFDTLPYYLAEEHSDTSGQKVNKLLNVYGRGFDDINKFIDGLSFSNVITYNKLDNMPDKYVKDLAGVLGWELISSVTDNNLLSNYISSPSSSFSGQSIGLTPVDADVELWRRLILNTAWIWKSKGARKSVEFLLRFIGTPNGLVKFNEYIYKADKPIDIPLFQTVLDLNGLDTDITNYPIDSDGYPYFFANTDTMYFQNDGLWYRETGGSGSTIDILTGNNPHLGPYDGGYKYMNQLRTLIPNFSAVTITSETTNVSSYDLFQNYNTGEITSYSGDTYVDVFNGNGTALDKCYIVNTTIIKDPMPTVITSPCGCKTCLEDDSLSICVEKTKITQNQPCSSLVGGPKQNTANGYYIFSQYQYNQDGTIYSNSFGNPILEQTIFVDKQCCTNAGGIPMYAETATANPNSLSNVQAGYACCIANSSNCGCVLSCNWILKDNPITIGSDQYCDFVTLYGLSADAVVTADGTNCPAGWTTPTSNIIDPHTGVVGFGCKINPIYLPYYSQLVALFATKANTISGSDCCTFSFPLPNITPPCKPPTDISQYSLVYAFNDTVTGYHAITSSNTNANFDTYMLADHNNITLSYYEATMSNTNSGSQVFAPTQTDCSCNIANGTYWVFSSDSNGTPTNPNNPSVRVVIIIDCSIVDSTSYTYVPPVVIPPVINTCTAPVFTVSTGFQSTPASSLVNTYVFATAQQSDGKFIVGGRFLDYQTNDKSVSSIVRINTDGSRDIPFTTNIGNRFKYGNTSIDVKALAIQSDGKILVGGPGICRINTDGTLDVAFNYGNSGAVGQVQSIDIQPDGKILIAGTFTTYNGVARYGIARLNSDGTLDTNFVGSTMSDYPSKVLLQPDGKVLLCGNFTWFNNNNTGQNNSIKYITRLDSSGYLDLNFTHTSTINGSPYSMGLQSDGKIILGGNFNLINNPNTNKSIVRLLPNGSLDTSFVGSIPDYSTNVGSIVYDIKVQNDDKIMVGGQMLLGNVARLLPNGAVDSAFNSQGFNNNSIIYTILPYCYNKKYLIGGHFTYYNSISSAHIVGLNGNGSINQ